jgi:hypothetical protein
MWADWLRNYIPRDMQEHRIRSTVVFPNKQEQSIQRRTGDPHSRRIKCVCRDCNNTWMSQLQESAKPFVVPMLEKQETMLYRNGQTVVAAWITMMVMVAEHLDPDKIAISATERRWFYTNRRSPSHWRIWIGQHHCETHPLYTHNVLQIATKEEEIQRLPLDTMSASNTQTSTICLGEHLIIHVMSSTIGRSIIRRWKLPPQIEPLMSQIWPVRANVVTWPASAALTDAGINLLAQQLFNRAAADTRRRMDII